MFEFDAGDQLAAGGDDVVGPVHHIEVAPGRDAGHVAGAQPPVDEPLRGVVAEIARRHPGAPELEFAHGPSVVRLDTVAVDDAGPDPGGEAALPENLRASVSCRGVRIGPGERGDRAGLGEAVRLDQRDAVSLHEGVEQRFRHSGSAHDDLAQVRQRLRMRLELTEELLECGGGGHEFVGAEGAEQFGEVRAGVEPFAGTRAGGGEPGAGHQRGVRQPPGHDVVHGHRGQDGVTAAEGGALGHAHLHGVEPDGPVRVGDALGVAGGAGGVGDRRRGPFVQFGPRVGGGSAV